MAARYFLIHILFVVSCLVAGQASNYALKGGKVSLKPVIPGHPDGILWKYNGNKVVEFNGREEEVYSPYENRITLDWVSAELDISDLRPEDSGDYELEVVLNKKLDRSLYKLEVIDKVPQPTITCEMNDGDSSNTSGKLLCSAELSQPQPLMKFEWRTHGNVQPGPQLHISLGDERDDEVYSCVVSNRLSSDTATFAAKDCYPEASSALLIALLVTGAVLLLVGLAILYCKLRHKVCFAKDVEKRSPPGRTEDSDTEKAQADERRALVHRASTLPSTQRLGHLVQRNGNMRPDEPAGNQREDTDSEYEAVKEPEMNKQDEMPQPGHVHTAIARLGLNEERKKIALTPPSRFSSPPALSNLACDDKGDADAEHHREPSEEKEPQSNASDSEKDNEPEPAGVSDDFSEDTQSSPKSPISPEHPEPEMNKQDEMPQPGHVDTAIARLGLNEERKKIALTPPSRFSSPPDLSNLACDDKGDADAEHHREPSEKKEPQSDASDSEKDNEPEPAGVSDDFSEDTQSSPKSPISPEHPEPEKEADEDEDEEAHSAPADAETSPAARPHSPLTESAPDMAPEDTASEHEEVANSDQVDGEPAEKNVRESDSSDEEERNESDDSSEDKLLSTVPEQRGSNTLLHDLNLSQEEANTSEDNEQETVKPVSVDDDESKTESLGDHEETDREQDLYSATSQQPRSPTPTKPDNGTTDTRQESPATAHAHPEEEEEEHKTGTDSDETEGQSDEGEGETAEDKNEVPCGLKGGERGNESCSGDNAAQKKDEVVA